MKNYREIFNEIKAYAEKQLAVNKEHDVSDLLEDSIMESCHKVFRKCPLKEAFTEYNDALEFMIRESSKPFPDRRELEIYSEHAAKAKEKILFAFDVLYEGLKEEGKWYDRSSTDFQMASPEQPSTKELLTD